MTAETKRVILILVTCQCANFISISAKAVFERSKIIDLSKDYSQYELNKEKARSVIDCSVICYRMENCRSFLMNQGTGECKTYIKDLSELTASDAVMDSETNVYYKDTVLDLVSGRGANSWQISQIRSDEGFPYLALDGNASPWWSARSCIHTRHTKNPWWAVDLGGYAKIQRIEVYQRKDSCCVSKFANVVFMVGDSVEDLDNYSGAVCARFIGPASTTPFPITIYCDSVVWGKYLKVYIDSSPSTNLAFCEIKVFSF